MNDFLKNVLNLIFSLIYPLVELYRRAVKIFSFAKLRTGMIAFGSECISVVRNLIKRSRGFINTGESSEKEVSSAKPISGKNPVWKNKLVILTASVSAAIIISILSVSLPAESGVCTSGSIPEAAYALGTPYASYAAPDSSVDSFNYNLSDTSEAEASDYLTHSADTSPSLIPMTALEEAELSPGCHDPRVVDIQTRLMDLDYMDPDEPSDYYGWGTQYSLELFQRKSGLQVDGLAGEKTLAALFSPDAKHYTVKRGDRGSDVEEIQTRLIGLKYLKSPATGKFGTDTEAAVKGFQKRNGLVSDGSVGSDTSELLFSEDAKPAIAAAAPSATEEPSSTDTASPDESPSPEESPSPAQTSSPPETSPEVSNPVSGPDEATAEALIAFAKTKLGCKYVRGGKGPNRFDCSGFVYYCLNHTGYKIGYMTSRGWAKCSLPKVSDFDDMKPGDIICYSPHHVAIYIGNGQMIDASSSNGKVVQRSCTTSYWRRHFKCARRVF